MVCILFRIRVDFWKTYCDLVVSETCMSSCSLSFFSFSENDCGGESCSVGLLFMQCSPFRNDSLIVMVHLVFSNKTIVNKDWKSCSKSSDANRVRLEQCICDSQVKRKRKKLEAKSPAMKVAAVVKVVLLTFFTYYYFGGLRKLEAKFFSYEKTHTQSR